MIAAMRRVTVISTASRRRVSLARLRELGVMHIEQSAASPDLVPELKERIETCQKALSIASEWHSVERRNRKKRQVARKKFQRFSQSFAEKIAFDIVDMHTLITKYQEQQTSITRQQQQIKVWGGYSHSVCEFLAEHGLYCRFYVVSARRYRSVRDRNFITIKKRSGYRYLMQCVRDPDTPHPFPPHLMPEVDGAQLEERMRDLQQLTQRSRAMLMGSLFHVPILKIACDRLLELNTITRIRHKLRWEGEVIHISGFVPLGDLKKIQETATKMGWGLLIREPYDYERVPTKLQHSRLVSAVNPLLSLLGTVPDYREPDISALFLYSFLLFFAIIIGDAGYALLLGVFAVVFYLHLKRRNRVQTLQVAKLLLLSSITTFVWGVLSGNWFGVPEIPQRTFLGTFVLPQLDSFNPRSIPFVQWFCFIIAAIHLSIAHIWHLVRLAGARRWLPMIAQLGWLTVMIGLYSLVVRLILGIYDYWYVNNFPILIVTGFGLIIIFANQKGGSFGRGLLDGIKSIFNTFLGGISAFADVISYLRLFAVGLASMEIARSFNQLALGVADGPMGWGGGVLVIAVGHSLNIILGALALIVHGVRLNMLEFSSHIGVEWSGSSYSPFKKEVGGVRPSV